MKKTKEKPANSGRMQSNWNSCILVEKNGNNIFRKLNISPSYELNNSTTRYLSTRGGKHIPKKLFIRMFIMSYPPEPQTGKSPGIHQ